MPLHLPEHLVVKTREQIQNIKNGREDNQNFYWVIELEYSFS